MAEIVVREAVDAEDVALVRQLMQDYGAYLEAPAARAANICLKDYEQELKGLPAPYAALLLATVDAAAAGCVALKPLELEERACEIKRLWVGKDFRHLGLGRRLAEEAIQWARRNKFQAIYLDTVPTVMPEAHRLYRALGFVPVARYNGNPAVDVAFFRRPLSE
jgi:GNAT superfamily N-acetyltransferase